MSQVEEAAHNPVSVGCHWLASVCRFVACTSPQKEILHRPRRVGVQAPQHALQVLGNPQLQDTGNDGTGKPVASGEVPHLVFAGGGTLGHLTPGLAVAEEFTRHTPHARITFVGTSRPRERLLVKQAGFDYQFIPCAPSPSSIWRWPGFAASQTLGLWQSRRFLHRQRVQLVVGLGGYASVPMGLASRMANVPLVLLEQNAAAGRATRFLARGARLICLAMESAREGLPANLPIQITGNPVRRSFLDKHVDRASNTQRCLLILGGSGGAKALNEVVPAALERLQMALDGWRVVHQAGPHDVERTQALYNRFKLPADVVSFIDDMPAALQGASLVVSRAGGTTLAELAVSGAPCVLAPYPHARDDHQRLNADVLVNAGGARCIDFREVESPSDVLIAALGDLLTHDELRQEMARNLRNFARPQAAQGVAQHLRQLAPV